MRNASFKPLPLGQCHWQRTERSMVGSSDTVKNEEADHALFSYNISLTWGREALSKIWSSGNSCDSTLSRNEPFFRTYIDQRIFYCPCVSRWAMWLTWHFMGTKKSAGWLGHEGKGLSCLLIVSCESCSCSVMAILTHFGITSKKNNNGK